MTKPDALYEARKRAKRWQVEYFIVWSVEAHDYMPGEHYHPANDEDLEGFYLGCDVLAVVQPDGSADWSN